jgi:Sulfotransferase family
VLNKRSVVSTEYRSPIWFLLARQQRLAYLWVPKAGSVSMRAVFCWLNHPEIPREEVLEFGAFKRHPEWDDLVDADSSIARPFFKFTFVRDPYTRFASFYRSKIRDRGEAQIHPRFQRLGFVAGMSIEQTFDHIEAMPAADRDLHFTPQSYFVFGGRKARVDFIGKLEHLADGIEKIADKTGIRLDLPRLNATDGAAAHEPRETLSPAMRQRVAKLYAEDFERFGYQV